NIVGHSQAQVFLGIDPGVSGGLAFLVPDAGRIAVEDMPTVSGGVDAVTLANRIRTFAPNVAAVENVHSMPGQGVSSVFKFGQAQGVVLGVLATLQIPVHLVAPITWKKHFRLGADKEQARALALRLFPACGEHFSRKTDHNRAEAALIAKFAADTIGGGR